MIREENYINRKLNKNKNFIKYLNKDSIIFSLIIIIVTLILYLVSLDNYLLFHSLAESFSIVISCGIFMVIWNSRRYIDNNFFIIIGIALLFVSFFDLIHTFTYKGINIILGYSTNLPTQIWIASRFLEGITYLAAPFFIGKKVRTSYIFYIYVFVTAILLASIFYWRIFPQCFIEGYGLTPFKKISEYVISLFLVGAIYFLYKKKDSFARYLFYMIEFSIALTILSELIFTLYTSAYGIFNFVGHILKIFSFYVIYKAIVVVGLKNPFNTLFSRLKQKEEDLQLTRFSVDKADDLILWISPDGYIMDVNDTTSLRLNYTKDEIIGLPFVLIDTEFNLEKFQAIRNKSLVTEHYFKTKDEDKVPVEVEFNFLEYSGRYYYCAFARDITERKKAQETLLESEARFRSLADNAPAMIWMSDIDKSRIYYNRRWLEFTGNNLEQELSNDWLESVHPEDRDLVRKNYNEAFNERKEFNCEYRLKRYNGQYRLIFDTGIPRFTPDGNFLGYIGSCYDVTERKQSRQQMELSLSEKVTLLKEIHHRVKNNLQVISSLLRLQSTYIKDDEAREIFIESQNRIRSMALIHQKLYLSKDLTHINFPNYINELVSSLLNSFNFNSNNISLNIDVEDIELHVDIVLNIGLIINELVSNSFKYAFPDGVSRDGNICELLIKLKSVCDGKYILIIKDNGIGLPANVDYKNSDTLGLQIVAALVEQYKGIIELNNDSGTEYTITFNS